MNKLFAILALGLCLLNPAANAAILGAPYIPEVDSRFNALETLFTYPNSIAGGTGIFPSTTAKGIVTLTGTSGVYTSTGIVLPANAILEEAWVYTATQIQPTGTQLALQCITAGDVFAAADKTATAAGGIYSGVETGTAANMLYDASGCTVKWETTIHQATSGVIDLFINYTVAN